MCPIKTKTKLTTQPNSSGKNLQNNSTKLNDLDKNIRKTFCKITQNMLKKFTYNRYFRHLIKLMI